MPSSFCRLLLPHRFSLHLIILSPPHLLRPTRGSNLECLLACSLHREAHVGWFLLSVVGQFFLFLKKIFNLFIYFVFICLCFLGSSFLNEALFSLSLFIPTTMAAVASPGVPQSRSQTGFPLVIGYEGGNTPQLHPSYRGQSNHNFPHKFSSLHFLDPSIFLHRWGFLRVVKNCVEIFLLKICIWSVTTHMPQMNILFNQPPVWDT